KRGWSRPLPWDRNQGLMAAGLYWEWIVRKGRELGAQLQPDYLELRYEDLVNHTPQTLASLAVFLAHDLDYERIKRTSIGSVKTPLTSFKEDLQRGEFKPVGRWRDRFSPLELATFERLVGNYLMQLGYALSDGANHHASSAIKRKRQVY